ncbi:MAG TPA: phospholipase D-like domain-containing protein [Ramlibacter sp.]|nr:phospholipase D-like domain-containing protein [Ramlibacter sp.]
MNILDAAAKQAVQQEIAKHLDALAKLPGFVAAEPGFPLVGGRFLREPAVIVLVDHKRRPAELLPEERVPRQLGRYRVSVMQADPERQLAARPEFNEIAAAQAESATHLVYKPPAGKPIDKIYTVDKPFLCHVGPDAGWPVLQPFLEATKKDLTVAMYDFNASHVLKTFVEVVKGGVTAALSWDSGMNTEEQEVRKKLRPLQKAGLTAWLVQCGKGRRFASAYHPKVAVRDHKAFWLSSGNWSKRSQPDLDPIADPKQAKGMFSKGNREWHVVCENEELARVFEQYILHDLQASQAEHEEGASDAALSVPMDTGLPDVFVPLDALVSVAVDLAAPADPTEPARLPLKKQPVKVQPVLTPDNYLKHVNKLVDRASSSLYLQFAYINWSDKEQDAGFRKLLLQLAELSTRQDLDMRIILGNNAAADKIRLLVQAGFNQDVFRVQGSIHNKGIIVDGESVLVSSTNWSADGVLRNRDAGVIIHNAEVAQYYQQVFLDDWDTRARPVGEDAPMRLAVAGEATPPGMVRMTWSDFYG